MKKILLIDDGSLIIKICIKMVEGLSKECTVLPDFLSAASIDEAREKFLLNQNDIVAVVMDGEIIGPSAVNPDPEANPNDSYPNSIVLVREFRKTYKGPIIASSHKEVCREILIEAGCDYEVSIKSEVARKLIEILGL